MRKEPIYAQCLNCGRNMLFIEGDVCKECLEDTNTEEPKRDLEYEEWLDSLRSDNADSL